MKAYKPFFFITIYLIIFFSGCEKKTNDSISDKVQSKFQQAKKRVPKILRNLKHVSIFRADNQPYDTLKLTKTQIFKGSSNAYINGLVGRVAVDNKNRVYISAGKPHAAWAVYVFRPDGQFLRKVGHIGKGPGEFLIISSLTIRNHKLYVADRIQHRISIFSLDDFKLLNNYKFRMDNSKNNTGPKSSETIHNIFVTNNDLLSVEFQSNIISNQNRKRTIYRISKGGRVMPDEIFEAKRFRYYMPKTTKHGIRMPATYPFLRRSFIAVDNKGGIYMNWSQHFLIKVYDYKGEYKRSIYYPYKNSKLIIGSLKLSNRQKQLMNEQKQVPGTWPAVHTMFMDDKNRLWVFTITNSKNYYKGWVLNKKGKLLARFSWPGRRASQSILSKPVMLVKNGYLYKREINLEKDLNQVVKYKIRFKKNK